MLRISRHCSKEIVLDENKFQVFYCRSRMRFEADDKLKGHSLRVIIMEFVTSKDLKRS